jgi:hypothetical protein
VLLAPVQRLQSEHVGEKWRSEVANVSVIATLAASQPVDVFALMGLVASTIRVRMSDTDPTGAAGEVWDSGVQPVSERYRQFVGMLPAPANASFVRIDLVGTPPEAGRLFIGLTQALKYNFSWGAERRWLDLSRRRKTEGGQTQTQRRAKTRVWNFSVDHLTTAEVAALVEDIDAVNGLTNDLLFIRDPDSSDLARDTLFGLMTDLTPVADVYFNGHSKRYEIEGRL